MTSQPSSQAANLDASLTLRAARWSDLNAAAQLIYAVCEADGDTTLANTPEELKNWWETEGFNIETDAFVIETRGGQLVGYEELVDEKSHAHLHADGYVHPKFKGMGIGTTLLRAAEIRAREHIQLAAPDLRVFIRSITDVKDRDGKAMFAHEGYAPIRYHWRMEIKLNAAPPAPVFPSGIELRPFIQTEHARAVWEAENEAFRDHWGTHTSDFADWQHKRFGKPDFDPTLWMIAWAGGQIAGMALNRFRMGIGWVSVLGVRRAWRKHGLGLALLNHSFGEFYARGKTTIGLGVDASNPTGATRLYQRAGMYAASEFVTYEKTIRIGSEISVESGSE